MNIVSLIHLISTVAVAAGKTVPTTTPPTDESVCGGKAAEIFFLVDSSSSIWYRDYKKQSEFVANVVDKFTISPNKTRVGLAVFSTGYRQLIALDQYYDKEDIKTAIKNIPYMTGDTYTDRALYKMRTEAFHPSKVREGVIKIGILLTDGKSRFSDKTLQEAELTKQDGIFLFAVGIGNKTDFKELISIGSDPKENFVFQVGSFDVLAQIRQKLAWKACEVEFPQGDQPACGKNVKADIMFVYDAGSLGSRKVSKINKFVVDIVQNFNMVTGNIRTGITSTNCYRGDISLAAHTDKNSFIAQLEKQDVPSLSSIVRRLRQHGYDRENGGRDNVKKIAILFMDDVLDVPKRVMSEVSRAKFDKIEIFVMAIGSNTDLDMDQVNRIATSPNHVIRFNSFNQLTDETKKDACLNLICNGEFPTTTTTLNPTTQRSQDDLGLIRDQYSNVTARIGYITSVHSGVSMVTNINKSTYFLLLLGLLVKHGVV